MSRMNNIASRLLLGASVAAMGLSGAAVAQDDAEPAQKRLSTVTVTATQRSESIQDVPIAVTALGEEQLENAGVVDIRSLVSLSPSLNFTNAQSSATTTSLRIRGVGSIGNNPGFESSVGIFVDGVYQARPGVALGEFVDVEQVELLRGPQGTLFGRNTSSGALVVRTNAPKIGVQEGSAEFTYGNENLVNVKGVYNIPVNDQFALRAAGSFRQRDGFYGNSQGLEDTNDVDRLLLRGQALWEPNNDLSVRVIADYSESEENCCGVVVFSETPILPLYTLAGIPGGGVTESGPNAIDDRLQNGRPRLEDSEQFGISAELVWDLGGAELTIIPAYRDFESSFTGDSDFVNVDFLRVPDGERAVTSVEATTFEARLQGEALDGRLDWLFGGFYADEEILAESKFGLGADADAYMNAVFYSILAAGPAADPLALGPNPVGVFSQGNTLNGSLNSNVGTQSGETFSVFTHNIFDVTDDFSITAGLRYVDEKKSGGRTIVGGSSAACAGAQTNPGFGPGGPLEPLAPLGIGLLCNSLWAPEGTQPFQEVFEDDELTYVFSGRYEFTDNVSAYLSYSHGFKSGGINLDPSAGAAGAGGQSFVSEVVDSVELGLKSDLFDGRVRANVTLFDMDIDDLQYLTFDGTAFRVFNIAKANSSGAEIELEGQVNDWLSLNAAFAFTDASYPDDCGGANPDAEVAPLCGNNLPNAPEFTTVLGANVDYALDNGMRVRFIPSVRYEDESSPSAGDPTFIQDSSTLVDLRLALTAADDQWSLELWGKNVTDEDTLTRGGFSVPFRGLGPAAAKGTFLIDPASYGVTLKTRF